MNRGADEPFRPPGAPTTAMQDSATGVNPSPAARPLPASAVDNERDQRLLELVAQRDRDAFQHLYQLYHRRLARFLVRLTRRQEIAEEIINDTLWIVWRKAPEFRRNSMVSTWILGIAYRRGLKTLRRQQAIAAKAANDNPPPGDESISARERAEWVERALAQLPVEQRMALELCYYMGYSHEEIAQIMDCPVNTVKTRMYYARQKMKILLARLEQ
jgi:RNA polymerase sigma-70 factor (ECF subfamily)